MSTQLGGSFFDQFRRNQEHKTIIIPLTNPDPDPEPPVINPGGDGDNGGNGGNGGSNTVGQDLWTIMDTNEFSTKLLNIIRAMSVSDQENPDQDVDLNDTNPFDNIVRDELQQLFSFRKISKSRIQIALNNIVEGQLPHLAFTQEENHLLLDQSRELEIITQEEYQHLIDTDNVIGLWDTNKDGYKELLEVQNSLPRNIPTIEELELAGIDDKIIETVKLNPETVVDEDIVKQYTANHIDDTLLKSHFIGYAQASNIIAYPEKMLFILSREALAGLFERTKGFLPFLTNERIIRIYQLSPNEYDHITDILSKEEILAIIDKDIDIKNLVLRTLSFEEVNTLFAELASTFKGEFESYFNDQKIMSMIETYILEISPMLSLKDKINNIRDIFGQSVIGDVDTQSIQDFLTRKTALQG